MASNSITKFATVFVVLVLTLCVCAPVVASVATTTETVTTEMEYGANTIDSAEYGTISSYKVGLGLDFDINRVSATFPYAVDSDGTYVRYSAHTLTKMTAYLNDSATFIVTSDLSIYTSYQLGSDISTYPATVTVNGWTFTLTRSADNNQIIEVNTTTTNDGSTAYILVPYDVTYSVPSVLTYGDNSIHSLVLTDSIGTMSGTTFTPSPGGDYLAIPVRVLTDNQSTYYVKNGDTYYAPDTNGDLSAFVAPSTTGVNSALTLTFTSSQTYTDVYELTGSSTDSDLQDVVIKLAVEKQTIDPVVNYSANIGSSYFVTQSGDLYATGLNSSGQLGTGDNTNRTTWEKVASNVAYVDATDKETRNAYYIATNGDLYAVGNGNNYQLGTGDNNSSWTWVKVASNVAKVKGYNSNSSFAFYIATNGDLYGTGSGYGGVFGNGSANDLQAWTKLATDVVDVWAYYCTAYYLDTSGNLYGTGMNGNGQLGLGDTTDRTTWTLLASDVDAVAPGLIATSYLSTTGEVFVTGNIGNSQTFQSWTSKGSSFNAVFGAPVGGYGVYGSDFAWLDSNGILYGGGQNGSGQLGASGTIQLGTSLATGVDSVKLTIGISFYTDTSGRLYVAGPNANGQCGISGGGNVTTWTDVTPQTSTIVVTNTVETETVSDLRGTVTNNVFTPSLDGAYLYVPIIDFDTYTYYVSNGSTVYAPDTSGNALAPHIVPDTTGIYPDLTVTLTQVTGYNNQIYSVYGSSTDTDEVGVAIPYTVTYNGYVETHYAYNGLGDGTETYYYWTDANGDYLYIPGDVLNSYSAYVDSSDDIYGIPWNSDNIVAVDSATPITGLVLYRDTLTNPNEVTGSGNGFIILPVTYTGGTNAPHTAPHTVWAVRGTVTNNVFTEDDNGDYLSIPIPVLVENTYHIGKGKVYYPVNMNNAHYSQTAPMKSLVNTALHLTFTADDEIPTLYELTATSSDLSLRAIWIPYIATYDVTETTTHELIPMANVIVMVVILLAIVASIGGIMRLKGGHF